MGEKPGLFGRIAQGAGSLFGGPNDPRVSPVDNATAARNAIIQAGLATVAGSGPGSQGTLPTLAQAVMLSRQGGAAERQQAVVRGGQEDIAGMLTQSGIGLPQLREALLKSITTGDIEGGKLLAQIIPSLQAAEAARGAQNPANMQTKEIYNPTTGITEIFPFNPDTGRIAGPALGQAEPSGVYERTYTVGTGDPDGKKAGVYGVLRSGEGDVYLGPPTNTSAGGTGGVQAARMRGLAGAARRGWEALYSSEQPLDQEMTSFWTNLSRRGGDTFIGDAAGAIANWKSEGKSGLALTASMNMLNPMINFLTGAAMSVQEAGRYSIALLPKTWDPPQVRALKRQMSESMVLAMEEAARVNDSSLAERWLEEQGNVELVTGWEMELDNPPDNPPGLFDDLVPRN